MDNFPHPTVASLALRLKRLSLDQALNEMSASVAVVRRAGSQRPTFLLDAEFVFDQTPSVRPSTTRDILMPGCEGQAADATRHLDASKIKFKRDAHDTLCAAAEALAYEQLFARCAEVELLPHGIARMNAAEATQYLARLGSPESAIEAYRPQSAAPVRIEEADPDNEYLGWDKVLSRPALHAALWFRCKSTLTRK